MLKKIGALINRAVSFFDKLLSDDHSVSLKRFISINAFLMFVIVIVVACKKELTQYNVELLKDAFKYLFGIIGIGIGSVAATDIFKRDER